MPGRKSRDMIRAWASPRPNTSGSFEAVSRYSETARTIFGKGSHETGTFDHEKGEKAVRKSWDYRLQSHARSVRG